VFWALQSVESTDEELWERFGAMRDDGPFRPEVIVSMVDDYYALIQNDPLTFFTNKNLRGYLKSNLPIREEGEKYWIFDAAPGRPLPWGANCLIYDSRKVKHFWERVEYIGDNDVFQMMLEEGNTRIAYNDDLLIYHHTVGTLWDWIGKWKRNMGKHFLANRETRNLNWINVKNFKLKLVLWVLYSLALPVSLVHAAFLALRDRNIYWLYHPFVSLAQALTYVYVIFSSRRGWALIADLLRGRSL